MNINTIFSILKEWETVLRRLGAWFRRVEVIGARWDEIDMASQSWLIPVERMKAGKEHKVPLSQQAMAILHKLQKSIYGKPISVP